MLPISDKTTQTIEHALDALAKRAEVTAHNVANSEVPGYTASTLDFEGELRRAVLSGDPGSYRGPAVNDSTNPPGPNGNNVNLEEEVVDMMKTNLPQDAMVEAYNFKMGLLRTAARGQ